MLTTSSYRKVKFGAPTSSIGYKSSENSVPFNKNNILVDLRKNTKKNVSHRD